MSKKEKEKGRKGDGARETGSAWIADLRPPRSSRSEMRAIPPSSRPTPVTHTDEETSSLDEDLLDDTRLPNTLRPGPNDVPDSAKPSERPAIEARERTEDVGEDTQADIAPIGPTEYAGIASAPPESGGVPTQRARTQQSTESASVAQLEQQIRDLEARLDEMIGRVAAASQTTPRSARETRSERAPVEVVTAPPNDPVEPRTEIAPEARTTARDLLPQDFYLRQWGRAGMRRRAEEVDEFGHDPKYEERFRPFFDFVYGAYFRVEVEGTNNIPGSGGCLIVANHSGGPLPYDGIMLRTTVRRELREPRDLRWLAEDFIYHLPFVGTAMNRLGAVRACQENAERLLANGKLVAVFPEGAKGIGKLFRDRYKLQRFGRGGFIRLCLRTRTPIVPCAIVGAEEANPMIYRLEYMAKTLGIPYLPITPTFPALGPLGLLPAPTKWKVTFGEPIAFEVYGPEAADDDILVGRLAERVRATIQALLDRTLAGRRSIWFG